MATRDFFMLAAAPGATVDTQADYAGSGYQENEFQPGVTLPTQFNKGFRQGTAGMAVLAQFIINVLNENVVDSGASEVAEVSALAAQLAAAILGLVNGAALTVVTYSATPVFDCSAGTT